MSVITIIHQHILITGVLFMAIRLVKCLDAGDWTKIKSIFP